MAWMTIDQKREMISEVYPADWWKMKVDAMPDHQVAAIYNRMLASGELKEPKRKADVKSDKLDFHHPHLDKVYESEKKFESYDGEQIKFKF